LNGQQTYALAPALAAEWLRLTVESLSALIVSDERRDWILANYPPEKEAGRPGILHPTPRGEKRQVREMDAPVEGVTGQPDAWRVTFDFDGNEDALELAEVAAD
jgi:hypothetical protein